MALFTHFTVSFLPSALAVAAVVVSAIASSPEWLHIFNGLAAAHSLLVHILQRLQPHVGGPGRVQLALRAKRLGEHVLHAGCFEHSAHAAAGNDARARGG